ncbi:MAG: hypothetical protein Q9165_005458 [Trypethelium subeluteriae]
MEDAVLTSPVYTSAVILAFFSLLNLLLDLPPFIFHARARNIAASSLILWILLMNLSDLINALIWANDNISNWYSGIVLCDIEVKLFIGAQIGQTGALICIMRELAKVLDTDNATLGRSSGEEKKRMIGELIMCWGLSVLLMFSHYVVQPARYSIFGINGCTPQIDNSWPAIVLVQMWPPIFALVDESAPSGLVIYRLHRYRTQFSSLLSASNTNKSRFLRLFLMALSLGLAFLVLTIYLFYKNIDVPHIPYSWKLVHDAEAWNEIMMVPSYGVVLIDRWIRVATGISVFVFFGVGKEAMSMYQTALVTIGLGRIFPRLKQGRGSTSSGSSSSFGSRAKAFVKEKWSGSRTISTINTSTLKLGRAASATPRKARAWYKRLFRRRSQDDGENMQLPIWNAESSLQPNSPVSTLGSISNVGKEAAALATLEDKRAMNTASFEVEIHKELGKEASSGDERI